MKVKLPITTERKVLHFLRNSLNYFLLVLPIIVILGFPERFRQMLYETQILVSASKSDLITNSSMTQNPSICKFHQHLSITV